MKAEMYCHLVDLTALQTSVSLTLGYLQAFAEADRRIAGRCRFTTQCMSLEAGLESSWDAIVRTIDDSPSERHVFAFTNYFWNRQMNSMLASRIKTILPSALVVFGGNDVTDQGETVLRAGSPVDMVVNGEGETVFANLLASHLDALDFSEVKGLSFRNDANRIVTTAAQPRIDDLDSIPSPFLAGVFSSNALIASEDITYEFSRGCPFKCAFCYWGAAIGTKTRRFSSDRIREDLEYILSHAKHAVRIWMADANFGMSDADVEIAYLLADLVQKHRKRVFLVTNWAKNTTKRVIEAATVLYRHGIITGVTLSAQSLNDETLAIAARKNIPFEYYRQLQQQFRSLGIPTYTELIFGMPGESYESFLDGVARVISAGGTPIIHPLLLLSNTAYNDPETRKRYAVKSRLMSYFGPDLSEVEIVIGHDRLDYHDWLKGMCLRLAVPLFYCGILKFVMRRLHAVHGLGYPEMLERLVLYCMQGRVRSHDLFRRIFLSYVGSWDSPENFDAPLIEGILVRERKFGDTHYRALMKVTIEDENGAGALISEFAEILCEGIDEQHAAEINRWVEYQKLLVQALSQAASGRLGQIRTHLESDMLTEYAGYSIAHDEGHRRQLRVRIDYKSVSLDALAFRVAYGTIDTLEMFAKADSARPSRGAAG